MDFMTIVSFLFFTCLVAVLTWLLTLNSDVDTDEGYFLAGRNLTGLFIAGSLLLTNLSTEQIAGLNGDGGWLASTFGSPFHYMGAEFALLVVLQLALSKAGLRRDSAYEQVDVEAVDLTPWKFAPLVGGLLCVFANAVCVFFAQ